MTLLNKVIPKDTEVIICGAGPVGLLAACLLGKYQINTLLIEKNSEPYQMPRAIALDDETLRILQTIGLDHDFRKIAKKAAGLELCSPKGKTLFTITKRAVSGKDASFLFYSPALEDLLRQKVMQYDSVICCYGAEFLDVEPQGNINCQINFENKLHSVTSKYLIACDGANSTIRQKTNFGWQSFFYTATNLKIDLELDKNQEYTAFIKKFIGPRGKAYVFLDSWHKHKRVEFALPKNNTNNHSAYLNRLSGILNTQNFKILHKAIYQFKSGTAKQWFKNNIVLAGDAAHLMPPYIGQGMCAGFRDVHNLCSKIMLVEKQGFSATILESYQKERKPHVRFVILLTIMVGLLFTSPLRNVLYALSLFLPKFVAPPIRLKKGFFAPFNLTSHKKSRLSGHLFLQDYVLNHQGEKIRSDFMLQDGFNLLFFVEEGKNYTSILNDEKLHEMLKKFRIKVIFLHFNPDINSFEYNHYVDHGAFYTWFKKHQQRMALIRPDNYIFDSCPLKKPNTHEVIKMLKPLFKLLKDKK